MSEIVRWTAPLPVEGDEVVDGEVVPESGMIEVEAWREPERDDLYVKFRIPERWYQVTDRSQWDELNSHIQAIRRLGRTVR